MRFPNFGPIVEVNACVKQLLVFFHGRCLWLDTKVSVDVDLIDRITMLPKAGVDPTKFFMGK